MSKRKSCPCRSIHSISGKLDRKGSLLRDSSYVIGEKHAEAFAVARDSRTFTSGLVPGGRSRHALVFTCARQRLLVMNPPLISVITPTFNSGEKIAATIASVLSQRKDLYEYL